MRLHGREPRGHGPAPRHVQRRPLPQDHAGGLRLPPPFGPGQPAAQIRGIRESGETGDLRLERTPGDYELQQSGGVIVEQVVRPTGLVDPMVEIRPVGTQVDDLLEEIRKVVARDERVLVTVLTKKLAEQLTAYYQEAGRQGRVPAQRDRHPGAGGTAEEPPPGRVRRARRHQPAPRGAGPAGSEPRGHPGRGQGGLPPQHPQSSSRPSAARPAT